MNKSMCNTNVLAGRFCYQALAMLPYLALAMLPYLALAILPYLALAILPYLALAILPYLALATFAYVDPSIYGLGCGYAYGSNSHGTLEVCGGWLAADASRRKLQPTSQVWPRSTKGGGAIQCDALAQMMKRGSGAMPCDTLARMNKMKLGA